LPPVKLHCSMLAEDSIKSAVENYKQKNKPWKKVKTHITKTPDYIIHSRWKLVLFLNNLKFLHT
jgi:hypothetical protein